MDTSELFYRFGTALAIGFLVGLQREFAYEAQKEKALFAGVRTFALIGIAGCGAAMLNELTGSPWPLAAALLSVGALVVAAYLAAVPNQDIGVTTEVAAILVFLVGAICYAGELQLAAALGVTVTMLLSFKLELQRLARGLTRDDVVALVKFGVITVIVLPLLPNEGQGEPPFDVLNPHKIWLMVVLISGLSFLGYALMKVVGQRRGIRWTGVLGGMASSTALTLSFSQRSRDEKSLASSFAVAILLAWITMFARVVAEVSVVNRELLRFIWIPMTGAGGAGLLYVVWLMRRETGKDGKEELEVTNPFELRPALGFGAFFAAILLVSRLAEMHFGTRGIYLSSVVAGLADVDAITLSMAELSRAGSGGSVAPALAATAITLAALSNTLVKALIVASAGSVGLKRAMWPGWALIVTGGLLAVLFL